MRNISADHRPMPFTCVNAAITSSSDIDSSESSGSAPLRTFSARSRRYGALLAAHADSAELLVRQRRQRIRRDAVRHQGGQPRIDRCCSFGRELLAGDGPNEGGEVVGSLRSREAARPVLSYQLGENRIATQQEPARTSVVVGFHGTRSYSRETLSPAS